MDQKVRMGWKGWGSVMQARWSLNFIRVWLYESQHASHSLTWDFTDRENHQSRRRWVESSALSADAPTSASVADSGPAGCFEPEARSTWCPLQRHIPPNSPLLSSRTSRRWRAAMCNQKVYPRHLHVQGPLSPPSSAASQWRCSPASRSWLSPWLLAAGGQQRTAEAKQSTHHTVQSGSQSQSWDAGFTAAFTQSSLGLYSWW